MIAAICLLIAGALGAMSSVVLANSKMYKEEIDKGSDLQNSIECPEAAEPDHG